jgi:hypothetical protein
MEAKKVLDILNEVFPGCEVFESAEDVLKARYPQAKKLYRHKVASDITVYSEDAPLVHGLQPLYCNYHGRLRVVDDPVCQYHLETFDPWCWERCETEWSINRLRPAFCPSYKQHKDSTPQKVQSPLADGNSGNLWGDR